MRNSDSVFIISYRPWFALRLLRCFAHLRSRILVAAAESAVLASSFQVWRLAVHHCLWFPLRQIYLPTGLSYAGLPQLLVTNEVHLRNNTVCLSDSFYWQAKFLKIDIEEH